MTHKKKAFYASKETEAVKRLTLYRITVLLDDEALIASVTLFYEDGTYTGIIGDAK
jgi:hypothetical protein